MGAGGSVPGMVLTSYENARNGGKEPEFNSLSYHGKVVRKVQETNETGTAEGEKVQEDQKEEWVVKIFSKTEVQDEWLKGVFGEVGWVNRRIVSLFLCSAES